MGATAPTDVVYHEIDELGNVVGSHLNAIVSQANSYDAWGAVTTFSPESRLLWKGLFWTGDSTGLYFMRNRWYDSEGERFLSEDPAGFAGGNNLYSFSDNDPVNGSDPYGLKPPCRFIGEPTGYIDGNVVVVYARSQVCRETEDGRAGKYRDNPGAPPDQIHGGGGNGSDQGPKRVSAPWNWQACGESAALAIASGILDVTAYKQVRAARLAMTAADNLFERAATRFVRNGGFFSGNVAGDIRSGAQQFRKSNAEWGAFWQGIQDRGLQASSSIEIIPWVGTGYLGFKAIQTCIGTGG